MVGRMVVGFKLLMGKRTTSSLILFEMLIGQKRRVQRIHHLYKKAKSGTLT
jgi:hypothetical protein